LVFTVGWQHILPFEQPWPSGDLVPVKVLPESLTTAEALDGITQLLLEKEALRRSLKVGDFGSRVREMHQAERLFILVIEATHKAMDLDEIPHAAPKLVLTQRLGQLPRKIVALFCMLLPVSLFLFYLSLGQPGDNGALWMVRVALVLLMTIPLPLYRRARLNIEHECGYARDSQGAAAIVIDQLPTIQFQSYVAHEYAHHLYFERFGVRDEEWMREGWARFVQWQVMNHLFRVEDNPGYLYHALIQIIGELKFACELISRVLRRKVPRRVRLIRSPYQRNPLKRLLTGTPGFDVGRLIGHAVGTAAYFLEAERQGSQKLLKHADPIKWIENLHE
jgi:hypothetical protein